MTRAFDIIEANATLLYIFYATVKRMKVSLIVINYYKIVKCTGAGARAPPAAVA